jgi:mRNA-degrading endonuclease RelE of RelBE toxin-antitoxin system
MDLIVSRLAVKALAMMPRHDSAALFAKAEQFAADPTGAYAWAKALIGGGFQLRHGDWRAICVVDSAAGVVKLERVGHRREIYR